MMNEELQNKLVELFWDSIVGYSWDGWCSMSSKDKEEIVPDVIIELGMEVDINEVYDLFWEWAEGLDEESFGGGEPEDCGPDLPTEVTISKDELPLDFDEMEEDEQEYEISEYLSDEYGFLHNGFSYEDKGDVVVVSEISWEIDDEDYY